MSERAYPSQAIRAAERPLLEAGVPLMERAARALALFSNAALRSRRGQVTGSRVCVLAGPGNNAGDALFAAASLARDGAGVSVVTFFERTHEAGLLAARRAGARVIECASGTPGDSDAPSASDTLSASDTQRDSATPEDEALDELTRADLVLDGIFGTGGRRGMPAHIGDLIRDWRRAEERKPAGDRGVVIAVDVPSDLRPEDTVPTEDAEDTASTEDAKDASDLGPADRIHAHHTLTFGGLKAELIDPRVRRFTGFVHVIDIGLDLDPAQSTAEVLVASDLPAGFPRPHQDDHKYSRGVLGIVAGSGTYPGAGVLTTTSAVGTGIGMIRYLGSPSVADRVLTHHPEVVTAEGRIDALVMGSGDPETEYVDPALEAIGDTEVPLVLDAGSLELIGRTADNPALSRRPVVLTPHAGELSRLLSRLLGDDIPPAQISADPLGWARRAAKETGYLVLLKGGQTVIACPDGHCVLPESGPASLATAGSGDVLSGIIGALLANAHARAVRPDGGARGTTSSGGQGAAQALDDREAARVVGLAVLVHNAAGRRSVNAGQLAAAVGEVVCELLHPGSSRLGPDGTLIQ